MLIPGKTFICTAFFSKKTVVIVIVQFNPVQVVPLQKINPYKTYEYTRDNSCCLINNDPPNALYNPSTHESTHFKKYHFNRHPSTSTCDASFDDRKRLCPCKHTCSKQKYFGINADDNGDMIHGETSACFEKNANQAKSVELELDRDMTVTAVVTQGRYFKDHNGNTKERQVAKKFSLAVQESGDSDFKPAPCRDMQDNLCVGNSDGDIEGMWKINYLQTPMLAKKIKLTVPQDQQATEFVSLQMGVYVQETESEITELKLYTLTRENLEEIDADNEVTHIESVRSDSDDFWVAYKSSSGGLASTSEPRYVVYDASQAHGLQCRDICKAVDPTLECHDDRAYDEDTKQKAMKELAHLFNDATEPAVFKFKASPVTEVFQGNRGENLGWGRFYDGEKVTIFVRFQVDASVQNDNMDMVVFDVRWVDDDALHRQRVRLLVNPGSQKFILEVNDGLDSGTLEMPDVHPTTTNFLKIEIFKSENGGGGSFSQGNRFGALVGVGVL